MSNIDKILSLAKAKGITNTFICKKLGVRVSYLTDVKRGNDRLQPNRLAIIAEILGTTVEYLNDETDDPSPVERDAELEQYLTELRSRSEMRTMFQLLHGAKKEDVEQAIKIIEALKK